MSRVNNPEGSVPVRGVRGEGSSEREMFRLEDLKTACDTLQKKGGLDEHARQRVHTSTGF